MSIEINFTKQNENDQSVFFTLIDNLSQSYKFHADIPKGEEPLFYIEDRENDYLLLIRKTEYSGCPDFETLFEMEEWIFEGHKIMDDEGNEIIIEKKPFVDTHIYDKYQQLLDLINNATDIENLKPVLRKMLKGLFIIAGKVLE